MAQYGRPSTDTTNEGYTDQAAGSTTIYTRIDEVAVDDADYIQSASAPTNDVYVTRLTTLEDPVSSSNHVVRYRYAKSAAGGATIGIVVQLRQAYTNEGAPGTLIKEWTHAAISETLTTQTQTLLGAEADAITDYTNLYLRFVFNQT